MSLQSTLDADILQPRGAGIKHCAQLTDEKVKLAADPDVFEAVRAGYESEIGPVFRTAHRLSRVLTRQTGCLRSKGTLAHETAERE